LYLKTELKSEYLGMTVTDKVGDGGCMDHWLFSSAVLAAVVV
jgi:hypothetical protein